MKEGIYFTAGLAFGILGMMLFPRESEEEQVNIEPPVPSTRKSRSENPRASVVNLENWRKGDPTTTKDRINSADREELQALVSELINKGDPYAGLTSSDQRLIESVLLQLMKGDAMGTVAWLQAAFQQTTSDRLLVAGIEGFLEVDFQQALELTLRSLDKRLQQELAPSVLEYGLRQGADQALSALPLMPDVSLDSRSGFSAQFPDDFDFEKFGVGTIESARSRVHQHSLSKFPSNFLSEWAKKDREGATSFYLEHLLGKSLRDRIIPFNDLEELMEAVFETSDVEEGASWVGRFIDGRELNRHDRRDLMSGLAGQEENGRLVMERLLQQEVGPAARSEKLRNFFESINSSYGREIDAFRVELLSLFPDANSRLDHLIEEGRRNRRSLPEITDKLRELGHSDEEIERVVNASNM